jgi:hypothetical protein
MTDTTTDDATDVDDTDVESDDTAVESDDVAVAESSDADHAAVAESDDGGAGEQLALEAGEIPPDPVRDRLLIPLLLPFLAMIAVALYTLNVSRIFLAGGSTSALVIATLITVLILAGAATVSASPRLRTSSLAMMMGFVLVIVVSGGLLTLGPSLEHGEEGGGPLPQPSAPPVATVSIAAGPGTSFNGVKFDGNYDTQAGVVEIDYTGEAGHTLQFRELDYEGFPLSTSGGPTKGKVELKPGTYDVYCTILGHAAAGMQATITAA